MQIPSFCVRKQSFEFEFLIDTKLGKLNLNSETVSERVLCVSRQTLTSASGAFYIKMIFLQHKMMILPLKTMIIPSKSMISPLKIMILPSKSMFLPLKIMILALKIMILATGGDLFTSLYKSWCHNPVATFSLCLYAQAYEVRDLICISILYFTKTMMIHH